jgi:hypothetical protein
MATLLERAGKTSEALPIYRKVKTRFDQEPKKNSMNREDYIKASEEAIRRLSAVR